jgi:oxygen-independent coproporphyrinogen-3 oxidase
MTARGPGLVEVMRIEHPRFAALPPLALYVHIPWCLKKCPYCDFNSHEARGEAPEALYVDALVADLELALPSICGRKIMSVFIGGGTPSLFSAAAIDRLLAAIRARVPLVPDAEVTLEANPGTFERAKFAGFFGAGVNRLSLGSKVSTRVAHAPGACMMPTRRGGRPKPS